MYDTVILFIFRPFGTLGNDMVTSVPFRSLSFHNVHFRSKTAYLDYGYRERKGTLWNERERNGKKGPKINELLYVTDTLIYLYKYSSLFLL